MMLSCENDTLSFYREVIVSRMVLHLTAYLSDRVGSPAGKFYIRCCIKFLVGFSYHLICSYKIWENTYLDILTIGVRGLHPSSVRAGGKDTINIG